MVIVCLHQFRRRTHSSQLNYIVNCNNFDQSWSAGSRENVYYFTGRPHSVPPKLCVSYNEQKCIKRHARSSECPNFELRVARRQAFHNFHPTLLRVVSICIYCTTQQAHPTTRQSHHTFGDAFFAHCNRSRLSPFYAQRKNRMLKCFFISCHSHCPVSMRPTHQQVITIFRWARSN